MSVADLDDLQRIPGIGPSLARDLADLGIRQVTELRRRNLEKLYERLCTLRGEHIDRCVLYAFRCAVYFASTPKPEPERLKWWNWKDTKKVRSKVA
jgi:predicted RecB family nuclease